MRLSYIANNLHQKGATVLTVVGSYEK